MSLPSFSHIGSSSAGIDALYGSLDFFPVTLIAVAVAFTFPAWVKVSQRA